MFDNTTYETAKRRLEQRRIKARTLTDERRSRIYAEIPEIETLDREIAGAGMQLVRVALGSKGDVAEIQKSNNERIKRKGELLKAAGYPEDYMENVYECPNCRDTGYVHDEMCVCMKTELSHISYENSNLAPALKNITFDMIDYNLYTFGSDDAGRASMQYAVEVCKNFVEGMKSPAVKNLYIFGSTGVGKTFLSAACANAVLKKGYSVLYYSAQKLFSMLTAARFGGDDCSEVFGCDLLIIDDLGTETVNSGTVSCFFELLNTRMLGGKKIIINTNMDALEVEKIYSPRILSRITEFEPVHIQGGDIRVMKNAGLMN